MPKKEKHADKHDIYGITILNDVNFFEEIKAHEYLFVLFYSSDNRSQNHIEHDFSIAAAKLADILGHDEKDADLTV